MHLWFRIASDPRRTSDITPSQYSVGNCFLQLTDGRFFVVSLNAVIEQYLALTSLKGNTQQT